MISACLIVKNEEEQLAKALGDLNEVCDELIVVDTGSTDRTIEIAEECGAKVYHYEWDGHFGRARNYSFSKARYEWIFYIDADERLSKSLKENIRSLIKTEKAQIFRFPIIDEMVVHTAGTETGPVRLFRKSEFRYDESPRGHTQTYLHNCEVIATKFPIIHCQRKNSMLVNPEKVLTRVAIDVKDFPKEKSSWSYVKFAFKKFFQEFYRRLITRKGWKDGWLGWKWAFMRALYYFLRYFFVALKPKDDEWKQWISEERTQKLINEH